MDILEILNLKTLDVLTSLLNNLTTLNQFGVFHISRPINKEYRIDMYYFEEGIQALIVNDDNEILFTLVKDNGETEWTEY